MDNASDKEKTNYDLSPPTDDATTTINLKPYRGSDLVKFIQTMNVVTCASCGLAMALDFVNCKRCNQDLRYDYPRGPEKGTS